jgi:hypothetical protein
MSHTRDPETEFGDPRRLADDKALTIGEKLEILEHWKLDLVELERAEGESMTSTSQTEGATAKKLAEVSRVMESLRERDAASPQPPKPEGGIG